ISTSPDDRAHPSIGTAPLVRELEAGKETLTGNLASSDEWQNT
ncbi:hypothetical protein TNCT_735281, partial [Trichonephila clavata]